MEPIRIFEDDELGQGQEDKSEDSAAPLLIGLLGVGMVGLLGYGGYVAFTTIRDERKGSSTLPWQESKRAPLENVDRSGWPAIRSEEPLRLVDRYGWPVVNPSKPRFATKLPLGGGQRRFFAAANDMPAPELAQLDRMVHAKLARKEVLVKADEVTIRPGVRRIYDNSPEALAALFAEKRKK